MLATRQTQRLWGLALLLCIAFVALGFRLVELQVVRHPELREKAQANTYRTDIFEPRRGDIRDVHGNLLATSRPARKVCADPSLIGPHARLIAQAIAPLLQAPEEEIARRLTPTLRTNASGTVITNQYVELRRKVPVEVWESIRERLASLPLPGDEGELSRTEKRFRKNLREKAVFAREDQMRVYPHERLASHVLGFVGHDADGWDIGLEGMELALHSKLKGTKGWRLTETDHRKRELVRFRDQEVEPSDGLNVVLTLDAGLQHIVEEEMAATFQKHLPDSITVIVVRPKTGEILAMASLPNFDPNRPGQYPADHRRNRAITDVSEPGSTFKVVVVAAALNERLVTLDKRYDCENGTFIFAGRRLHDDHPAGILSVRDIIAKSSNIGAAKIGIDLGKHKLHEYIRLFGFGERTGVYLQGEVPGIVHPVQRWNPIDISRIPMGHTIASTPLQMVMAMAAIANDGRLMYPRIVERLEDSRGRPVYQDRSMVVRQVIRPETARQMIVSLQSAASTNGTAVRARLDHYTVAGKTGTARKIRDGQYRRDEHYSSFIGFFPSESAEVCIGVFVDRPRQNGYYGGLVAAPLFKQIGQRAANYLGLRPDLPVQPELETPEAEPAGRTLVRREP